MDTRLTFWKKKKKKRTTLEPRAEMPDLQTIRKRVEEKKEENNKTTKLLNKEERE